MLRNSYQILKGGGRLSLQDKKCYILQELKKKGCRITNQRKVLIDVILRDECCSCKEIYYQAIKEDATIGMATVYRMVKTLEETGLIQRKNMYRIEFGGATA
ncbi:MAG: Fe2+/Zn2+ uptake regulation protein [Hungatella sp.]|nr:Fe2+/Zn2+ uptake regulation protein [Hungatella sp.]